MRAVASIRGSKLTKQLSPELKQKARDLATAIARPTAGLRKLPSVVIVGAQRAGTTSLYRYALEHPSIGGVRAGKGVHYFDMHADKPLSWYAAHFPTKAFTGTVMEATPGYLFQPAAVRRMAQVLPGIQVVAVLRNPIERAVSHHAHERARGFETLDLIPALDAEDERLAAELDKVEIPGANCFSHVHHSYVSRGKYAAQIERLLRYYPSERILLLASDDLFSDPAGTTARLERFIGLPPSPLANAKAHNPRSYDAPPPAVAERLMSAFADDLDALATLVADRGLDQDGRVGAAIASWKQSP